MKNNRHEMRPLSKRSTMSRYQTFVAKQPVKADLSVTLSHDRLTALLPAVN